MTAACFPKAASAAAPSTAPPTNPPPIAPGTPPVKYPTDAPVEIPPNPGIPPKADAAAMPPAPAAPFLKFWPLAFFALFASRF